MRLQVMESMIMPRLPGVVVEDIVSRLPVKSLLRFRSVSKSWRSSIDSSSFVKYHLNRSTNLSVLLISDDGCITGFDSVDRFTESGNLLRQILPCPSHSSVSIWGSCDGLIFLSWLGKRVLWNPATHEARELPQLFLRRKRKRKMNKKLPPLSGPTVYGFGHDITSDDYKVVRIILRKENGSMHFHDEVDVYSFKSNSWHNLLVDFPHNNNNSSVQFEAGQVLVHGAMHWAISEPQLVAFDLGTERFVPVHHPPTDHSPGKKVWKKLESFRGCFSVFFHRFDAGCYNIGYEVDIWAMKEYGVKESWTKLITVAIPERGTTPSGARILFPCVRPIACSTSGARILFQLNSKDLFWYDTEKNAIMKITRRGVRATIYPMVYTESLVSLVIQGGGEYQKQQGDGERRTRRKLSQV